MAIVHGLSFCTINTVVMSVEQSTVNMDHNLPEMGVGEISTMLKATVESAFQRVRVRGEISGFKRAPSGHLYMTLKDDDAVLDAVCWRGTAARLRLLPEDGLEVIATGRLTTYAGRSKYQIVVESFEVAGEGALLKHLEDRRRQLAAEGLFDADRKRELPFLPDVIGVVTSPTGAVIRDILHRLADRFPRRVLVWPVLVQGDGAAKQVAHAIKGFNALDDASAVPRPDVLIVARGGGSIEDLWAFNEDIVVRAAARSDIPLISAVGHETDTTLLDFAADVRAPTPTAAAEIVVPVRHELQAQVADDGIRLRGSVTRQLQELSLRLEGLARGLPDPRRALEERSQRLDEWEERLRNSLGAGLRSRRQNLAALAASLRKPGHILRMCAERLAVESRQLVRALGETMKDRERALSQTSALLDSYSYERILERGFALVADAEGKPVTSAKALQPGDQVALRFAEGAARAAITGTREGKPRKVTSRGTARPKSKASEIRQGKLL